MAGNENSHADLPRMGGPKVGGSARFAPHQKPKDVKRSFFRLMTFFSRYKRGLFFSILLTVVSAGVTVSIPFFTGKVFDTFSFSARTVDMRLLLYLIAGICFLYVTGWIVDTISGICILSISQKMVSVLRTGFFSKMQRLPLMFYDTTSRGDTMSRMTNDIDSISSSIAQAVTQIISGICSIAGSIIVMVSLSVPLTVVVLICVPLVGLLTRTIAIRSRSYFNAQLKSLGMLNGQVEECVHGFKMVKAFTREDEVLSHFNTVNQVLCNNSAKAQTWAGFMMPLMNVINNLMFTLVAVAGGILCTTYGMKLGIIVTFLGYAKQFVKPLNNIAGLFNTIQSALAGAERVFEIMDHSEELPDTADAVSLQHPVGTVVFTNVCFSYIKGTPVLVNINFTVSAGQTIALVGETGSGKTTIVNLLNRFYDADSGSITIDGIAITRIKRSDLRNCFSVVLQDTCLFSGTIMDNIRYSRPEASDDEVRKSAQIAHAAEFIERLPDGYATKISGSADTLSEGQQQLIAIARAVLCNSPILILDEATSSVDTKTEKDIQRAFVQLRKGRTCFLIAHRLSTIRDADKIFVIDHGEIIESGTHDYLMALGGHYCAMVQSQTGRS